MNDRYRTLFYGLKLNHPNRAAIVYPLVFLIRRIIYSTLVIFLAELPIVGAYILCTICLMMIAYVIVEKQWEDSLIAKQHIANEIALYLILVFATVCTLTLAPAALSPIGWTLICIFFTFLVVNFVFIAYYTFCYLRMYIRKQIRKMSRKMNNKIQ